GPRRVLHAHRVAGSRGPQRPPHRLRPYLPPGHWDRSVGSGIEVRRREGDHDLPHVLDGAQRVHAPLEHRPSGQRNERLGPTRSKALATSRGHDERDRHLALGAAYLAATAILREPLPLGVVPIRPWLCSWTSSSSISSASMS